MTFWIGMQMMRTFTVRVRVLKLLLSPFPLEIVEILKSVIHIVRILLQAFILKRGISWKWMAYFSHISNTVSPEVVADAASTLHSGSSDSTATVALYVDTAANQR